MLWRCILVVLVAVVAFGAEGEVHFLTNTRQLVFEGKRSGEGYFSADGKAMVFQSEREPGNPFYQIYVLDLESGDTTRVSPGYGKTTCAFLRPNSDEVLFASTHLDPQAKEKQKAELDFRASGKQRRYSWDYDDSMDIFVAKRDGSNIRRLTDSKGYDAEGSYSSDGKLIAFCSLRDAFERELSAEEKKRLETDPAYFGEIYLMNADGSNQRRLTHSPGYDGGPFFSSDGKRIIWRRFEENGAIADVYTMNLDGSDVRRLTDFKAMSWAPYFHPSGKYVIFASNKEGFSNFELYMVDAAGAKEPVRVTFTDGFDGLPVFSPDGKKLAWTSNRTSEKVSQIFIADWNDDNARAAIAAAPTRQNTETKASFIPEITEKDLKGEVGFLASEKLEGRRTGTEGAKQAAQFLVDQLKAAGVKPLGENYLQQFDFSAGVNVITNSNHFTVNNTGFELGKDFHPLPFTGNGKVEGDVVFAGYGLTAPASAESAAYDSYAGVNVSNKIVLVLRYVPEGVEAKRRQELNRYAGLRYKATIARNHGAKALLVVTGPNSPNAGELAGFASDGSSSGSDIVALTISDKAADALFAGSGKNLKELQAGLDSENPHAESSLALTNARVKIEADVESVKKQDHNVIGWLPGANTNEIVMLGAHYDHLGHGETGGFALKGEENKIHPGADDNASGCAAVLEIAQALAEQFRTNQLPHSVVFAFWSGEEIGLIGSSYYVEHPLLPLTNTLAYLNFDMVGRLRENKLTIQGVGSSSAWKKLLEKRNVAAGFALQLMDDPYAPTDVTAFYPKGVPVLQFFTGSHEEYHRPTDTPDTLNYAGMERVTKFALALTKDLAAAKERPNYVKVERSEREGGSRDALRVYLGTIPDYATEVQGVKLSGTRGGSPADKAGLKAGDIIVEFAGQKIANIYDYTYALDAAKIGQPVKVIVKRGNDRVEVTVIPEARK
ncbi:MAG TPA: M20/M25/M40 family metallo-hydrolase [Verrucomicrobiae bacterium]